MSVRLEKLKNFLSESPDDPFIKYAIATEYLQLNKAEDALRCYKELREQHPEYVGTYYHLGKLYEALNMKSEAIETYEKGMAVARMARDMHALSELQAVYNSATGLDDEE